MVSLEKNSFYSMLSPSPSFILHPLILHPKDAGLWVGGPRVGFQVITERPQFLGGVPRLHVEALGYRWGAQVIARGPRL